jgi:hypothetical protein
MHRVHDPIRDLTGYDRVMVYRSIPTATARSSPRRATRGSSRCSGTTTRPPTSRSGRASCTCATACACWSTSTTTRRRSCRAAARWRRRARHVAVLPAQHVAAAPAVPEEHGRDRDAGGFAGARGQAVGPDRLPPLRAAQPAAAVRAACELLAEVVSTRIAAIENYAHAQVAILVRRLEQRLIEATSTEGDWRLALLRNPRTLLQPLDATGAALFHDGEILTCGRGAVDAGTARAVRWVDAPARFDTLFSCASVARANPALESLTPTASGVLAVRLSTAARLPDVVPQGAAADGDLGRRPDQAGDRQRPAGSCRRGARSPPGPRSCAARRCPGRAPNWRWRAPSAPR